MPNVGRNLVAKKTLTLGSTELELIENCDIFDTYKDLYLTKKQRENMHFQGIQPENGLKARVGAKKSDGTDLTLSTAENAVKKTLGRGLQYLLTLSSSNNLFPHTTCMKNFLLQLN